MDIIEELILAVYAYVPASSSGIYNFRMYLLKEIFGIEPDMLDTVKTKLLKERKISAANRLLLKKGVPNFDEAVHKYHCFLLDL